MAIAPAGRKPQDHKTPGLSRSTAALTTVDAAQAEADSEEPESPAAILQGVELRVKPVGKWRSSAMRALRAGDLDAWAEKCLDAPSWEKWQEIDPTLDEAGEFLEAWTKNMGEDTGK